MAEQRERPGLLELFIVFFRVSSVCIGGGYVMFPLLKREVVEGKGWLTADEMVDYFALAQSIPGIIAMNTSTLIGYRKRGVIGAVVSALGMATPSVLVILLVAMFLTRYFDHALVQKAFSGIRAAVVALLIMAIWQVGKKSASSWVKVAMALGAFVAVVAMHVHPALVILAGGVLGFLLFRREADA